MSNVNIVNAPARNRMYVLPVQSRSVEDTISQTKQVDKGKICQDKYLAKNINKKTNTGT